MNDSTENLSSQWVSGYSETKKSKALVANPESIENCISIIKYSIKHHVSICPRGGGFTYYDMILNDDNLILDVTKMNKILDWSRDSGQITVQPGVTFADIFLTCLKDNWTLNSCPGGMLVTVGGAISNNVHGKDAWKYGNFGNQIIKLKLLTASGDVLVLDRLKDKVTFDAVVGGMGLLGIIVEATIQLRKVPSPFVQVSTEVLNNSDEVIDCIESAKLNSDFIVSWNDGFSEDSELGRGYVVTGKWIEADRTNVPEKRFKKALERPTRIFGVIPAKPFWFMARPMFMPWSIKQVNKLHYNLAKQKIIYSKTNKQLFTEYNFMHNKIPDIRNVYRPHGFFEFEPIIPFKAGADAVNEVFHICRKHGCQPLVSAIKAHKEEDNIISYAGDGYSIGLVIQAKNRDRDQVENFSKDLFNHTINCGGRDYLAKNEFINREIFQKMYPRYKEFIDIKEKLDPTTIFSSNMFNRLFRC